MRCRAAIWAVLVLCCRASPQSHRSDPPLPDHFEIGRHTFFDFGPPTDFYELLIVQPTANGASIERIMLTPAGDICTQPATIETASASLNETVAALLGSRDFQKMPQASTSGQQ